MTKKLRARPGEIAHVIAVSLGISSETRQRCLQAIGMLPIGLRRDGAIWLLAAYEIAGYTRVREVALAFDLWPVFIWMEEVRALLPGAEGAEANLTGALRDKESRPRCWLLYAWLATAPTTAARVAGHTKTVELLHRYLTSRDDSVSPEPHPVTPGKVKAEPQTPLPEAGQYHLGTALTVPKGDLGTATSTAAEAANLQKTEVSSPDRLWDVFSEEERNTLFDKPSKKEP